MLYVTDRPVPAVRRTSRGVLDATSTIRTMPGLVGAEEDGSYARDLGQAHLDNVTYAGPQRKIQDRRHYATATSPFMSYRSPGQPTRPVSTVRPQSAMALTSAVGHTMATLSERPPSSLGAASASSRKKSVAGHSMIYDDSCLMLPLHQRSHSYGEGVTLGEGHSSTGHTGERSEYVYATVSKRPTQIRNGDTTTGYPTSLPFERRLQPQVNEKLSGQTREQNTDQNRGGRDNPAFLPDDRSDKSGELVRRPASTSIDLRSAWQRLYGNSPDPTSRRPSAGDTMSLVRTPTLEDPVRYHYAKHQNTRPAYKEVIHDNSLLPPIRNYMQGHQQSPRFSYPQISTSNPHEPAHNIAGTATSPVDPLLDRGYTPSHNFHYSSSSLNNQLITLRESPTGQSSSNLDHTSGSNNSSQLSSYSLSNKHLSTFKPQNKKADSGSNPTIGPASKYPEVQKICRTTADMSTGSSSQTRNTFVTDNKTTGPRQNLSSPDFMSRPISPPRRHRNSSVSDNAELNVKDRLTHPRFGSAFLESDDSNSVEEEYMLKPHDSIFDYPEDGSDNGSATPAQPHRSPRAAPRSGNSTPASLSSRFSHKNLTSIGLLESLPKTPDLLRLSSVTGASPRPASQADGSTFHQAEKTLRSHLNMPIKEVLMQLGGHDDSKLSSKEHLTNYARSRSLDDVRESESGSILSLDIENTILTVEPSDQSEMGTVPSYKGSNSVKAHLNRLEGMYSHVMKALEESSRGKRARRRWSIGSSDTSSLTRHTHQARHSRMSAHRLGSKDVKAIGMRFQRLESHVITLARSVAHLSSELRAQNSLSQEIDNVKREMQELRSHGPPHPAAAGANSVRGKRLLTEFERYHGWVPSLTNPRRVNKLTKFFGQEPPLLEIFLKQLGYEKFLKNFDDEHIGMIELPYMTEERLQSIGIPMGPRLRILQEAQLHFKQANFDIYFV